MLKRVLQTPWSFLVYVKRLSHLFLYIKLMDTFILLIGETEMGAKCFFRLQKDFETLEIKLPICLELTVQEKVVMLIARRPL